ncbi:Aspartyl/asparaginyl-tRNA synthetase [mine drainage metagenome]|uniref:Aspartyl/asparaginyl-tRNA synthetase n=1 Tax=mine drainage metagenome TaxID=410659 RepID=T1AE42_9ZZZZ
MGRTYFIGDLNADMDGKEVTLDGWVHEVRELGNLTFLLLRDRSGIVQVIGKKGITSEDIIKSLSMPKESVVEVRGTVKKNTEAKIGFEIVPTKVTNLNPLSSKIPFEVTGKVDAELDVRLDYRYIDLRRVETTAVFKIESTIANAFVETVSKLGFLHIRTPSIVKEATEGGSDLFGMDYFEDKAYLAQSPQLYKQLAVIGGLDKVFTITPVFRAEKSNTVYHLNESTQMDIEMAFANHDDVISILSNVLVNTVRAVTENNAKDLDILGVSLAVPSVKSITYTEAVEALEAEGLMIKNGDDFSREQEKALYKLYGDAIVVKGFPAAIRAFYSMPSDTDPNYTNSFDLLYKGLEVSSGAQRIHLPELLIDSIKKKGMDPKSFDFYINAMRCGAPPHAGWSLGLERLTTMITGMQNIRECSMFPRDRKRLTP